MSITPAARTRMLRTLSNAILVAGLLASLVIYRTAAPPPDDPLGSIEDSKRSLRQLQMYGGEANVFAYEIRQWFGSLWQGTRLAVTVAVLATIAAGGCRFVAIPLPPPGDDAAPP
ncbi:MAG TPA: hypothetical protein VGS07_22365 [Thermoanaerobaculia bacterium]|jgi:hypothetical protein|nr:hypothetical protein [Thermoanaerobaculia bacterium]